MNYEIRAGGRWLLTSRRSIHNPRGGQGTARPTLRARRLAAGRLAGRGFPARARETAPGAGALPGGKGDAGIVNYEIGGLVGSGGGRHPAYRGCWEGGEEGVSREGAGNGARGGRAPGGKGGNCEGGIMKSMFDWDSGLEAVGC
jgi:hypothetical protein